jgi:hypothetical protein
MYGTGGSLIVGTLITNNGGYFGYSHAGLWQGPSHTFTDLNPAGSCGSCAPGSNAYATDGMFIAGSGGSPEHAAVDEALGIMGDAADPLALGRVRDLRTFILERANGVTV